jgi:hypothetical protein
MPWKSSCISTRYIHQPRIINFSPYIQDNSHHPGKHPPQPSKTGTCLHAPTQTSFCSTQSKCSTRTTLMLSELLCYSNPKSVISFVNTGYKQYLHPNDPLSVYHGASNGIRIFRYGVHEWQLGTHPLPPRVQFTLMLK